MVQPDSYATAGFGLVVYSAGHINGCCRFYLLHCQAPVVGQVDVAMSCIPVLLFSCIIWGFTCYCTAASTMYSGCTGIPPDWFPECPIAVYARIQVGGDRMFYWTPYTSIRWGNALSPYWQARALAELAGHGFNAFAGFDSSWLQYLPKEVPPQRCPNITMFNRACNITACDSDSWEYPHRCSGAWQLIRPTIITDTHAAVRSWADAFNYTLPTFVPGDTVIQSRCSRETLLVHDEFGPVGFSYYSNIRADAKNIYIVTDPRVKYRACTDIHAAQVKWLKQKYPDSQVKVVGGNLEHDFLRLLLAPVLFKDAQSSFGLWAGMANRGEVWSVPLLTRFANNPIPDLGSRWHWSDAPVLYPQVAKAASISRHNITAIINWLKAH